MKFTPHPSEER